VLRLSKLILDVHILTPVTLWPHAYLEKPPVWLWHWVAAQHDLV
jgi:hypothetical protein